MCGMPPPGLGTGHGSFWGAYATCCEDVRGRGKNQGDNNEVPQLSRTKSLPDIRGERRYPLLIYM